MTRAGFSQQIDLTALYTPILFRHDNETTCPIFSLIGWDLDLPYSGSVNVGYTACYMRLFYLFWVVGVVVEK